MKTNRTIAKLAVVSTVSIFLALNASDVFAAGAHGGGHGKTSPTGQAGKASDVSRTITVMMGDNFYDMENLTVKGGETIRFKIKNTGSFVHEFNIGTKAMHAGHNKEMMKMMEHGVLEVDRINHDKMKMDMGNGMTMQHNDPNSVLLEPGKSAEIVWKFPKNAKTQIEFACNIPGHYEAGMVGKVNFHKISS
ncbi:MAG: copper-binding protein [Alphaproteobacteria bacterium]|jgi:uncharacterized cupredoxin-like copper-binding protein|nr:copper-binding protein [Alphaproteobacteria bacterium]